MSSNSTIRMTNSLTMISILEEKLNSKVNSITPLLMTSNNTIRYHMISRNCTSPLTTSNKTTNNRINSKISLTCLAEEHISMNEDHKCQVYSIPGI